MNKFKYLGSILESHGKKNYCEIEKRIHEGEKISTINSDLWGEIL
jgi:hypothetical protein